MLTSFTKRPSDGLHGRSVGRAALAMSALVLCGGGTWFALAEAGAQRPSETLSTAPGDAEARELAAFLRPKAEAGDVEAMFMLGVMHDLGEGVAEDDAMAMQLFRRCAALGSADCERSVGIMYQNGQSVRTDLAEALRWFLKAAEHGNGEAAFDVANFHRDGVTVPPDEAKALAWYRKAADMGSSAGLVALGDIHLDGRHGIRADPAEARRLYAKAVEVDDRRGLVELGDMWMMGRAVRAIRRARSAFSSAPPARAIRPA